MNAKILALYRFSRLPILALGLCLALPLPRAGFAAGIPEPDLVMYGLVTNVRSNANIRLGHGVLTCAFQPPSGPPVVVQASLTNLYDEVCYVLRVPCQSEAGAFTAASNVVKLAASGIGYNRAQISWNGIPVSYVTSSQTNTLVSLADRGRVERADLELSAPLTDSDLDGLPDDWELTYFGSLGLGPNDDPDGDGVGNRAEFLAGTHPMVPGATPPFKFVGIQRDPAGGISLQWLSVSNGLYTLQRSANLGAGFSNLALNIPATPPTNRFLDSNATGAGPFFYRVRREP